MAESSRNKWFSDNLSEEEMKEELERRNFLPSLGITPEGLGNINSPSLEYLCEAVKTINIPWEVLISQNPIDNIVMYLYALKLRKENAPVPRDPETLVKNMRVFFWYNKDLINLRFAFESPLESIPGEIPIKRLENLPKPILKELEEVLAGPYVPLNKEYTREQAIQTIQDNFYKIYKQNNEF